MLKDIGQFIKFGDLTDYAQVSGLVTPNPNISSPSSGTPRHTSGSSTPLRVVLPMTSIGNGFTGDENPNDYELRMSDPEEDALVRESTASFSNFITSLFHRVITLMENLPEEGQPGTRAGGEDEGSD